MEKTGPTVRHLSDSITKIHFFFLFFSTWRRNISLCVFSATGAIQEEVVHTVLSEQEASVF